MMKRLVPLIMNAVAVLHRAGSHGGRIAAGVGFRLGEAEADFAAQHRL